VESKAGRPHGRAAAADQAGSDAPIGPDATIPAATATSQVAPSGTPEVAETASGTPSQSPATQLAMRLAPLRKGPDGVHRLTVHLNPVELGPVSVLAEVRDGEIHLQLAGSTEIGRQALLTALPELRKDLHHAGFGSCSLDLQREAPQGQSRQDPQAPSRARAPGREGGSTPPPEAPEPPPSRSRHGVDVRI
jgi:flagellar hook-length control protein FliK